MIYPDFHELIALKKCGSDRKPVFSSSVRSWQTGGHLSPFRGQGLEFDSVRHYVPGDDIRSIDWRVTARTGAAHVKLFKEDRMRQVVICVDHNASMRFGTKVTFKSVQAARAAAILGWRCLAQQDKFSACLFGDVKGGIQCFLSKNGQKDLCAMLKILSSAPIERHYVALDEALGSIQKWVPTGALVYVISDFLDVQATQLKSLSRRCDVILIAVNDRADKSIPSVGLLGFQTGEKDRVYIDTRDSAGRKAYEQLWEHSRKQLNEAVQKSNISLLEMTTESKISIDLILGLKKIAIRKR